MTEEIPWQELLFIFIRILLPGDPYICTSFLYGFYANKKNFFYSGSPVL